MGIYWLGVAYSHVVSSSEGPKGALLFGPSEEKIVGFMQKENPKDVSTYQEN